MAGDKRSIVIAEDHTILREGLRALISSDPNFDVVAEAKDGQEAIRCVEEFKPDLVLMDLSMPGMNGLDAIRKIRKRGLETKILALTVHKTEEYILAALKAGADGYLLKDATYEELLIALNNVLDGRRYLSPNVSVKVTDGYLEGRKTIKSQTSWETLTPRELQILKLIAEGYRGREIANHLRISFKTVEKHRSNLMEKLGLHNIQALTALAIEKGLISQ